MLPARVARGPLGRSSLTAAASTSSNAVHPFASPLRAAGHGLHPARGRGRRGFPVQAFGWWGSGDYVDMIVESGDTFLGIAVDSGCTYDELLELNGMSAKEVNDLQAGQILRVPKGGSRRAGAEKNKTKKPKEVIHIVDEGESLWEIAQDYGTTTDRVLEANNIRKSNSWMVQEGQELVVPVPNGMVLLRRRMQRALGGRRGAKSGAGKRGASTAARPGLGARVRAVTESDAFTMWLPLVGAALVVASLARLQQQNRALEMQRQEIWRMRITPDSQWPPQDDGPEEQKAEEAEKPK